MSKVIYIAGPYRGETPWMVEQNIRRAELASKHLWGMGVANVCPHTMGRFFDKEIPDEHILKGMIAIMLRCDAVLVVGNWRKSQGTMAEMTRAEEHGLPVFHSIHDVVEWVSRGVS